MFFGDGFRFDVRFDFVGDKVVDESFDGFEGDFFFLVEGEFLVFGCFLDGEGGEFVGFEVEVVSVGIIGFGVDGVKVDNIMLGFGDGFEFFVDFFVFFGCFGEDVGKGKVG